MAITPPTDRLWWKEPLSKTEITWISIAFAWSIIMFLAMIYWHMTGEQNLSNEAYRIKPEVFAAKAEAMVEQYQVGEEGDTGVPVVHPPPGSDVYLIARLWEWWPVLELEKGQSYRLHLSSMDWQHGFSLQPTNINIQVHPGYEMVLTITPNEAGEFGVVCNEYCGIGHHTMVGKIRVVE
ncbi:MAG: cytochrome C oxidase subunit II [Alphaproteobacteria bacterium]|nr:MAG: cytochrome C oxidase subunit II [Alphaproteobacteria bacterium]